MLAATTLASIAGHPVILDVIRRIVSATGQIDALERERKREARKVFASLAAKPLKARQKILEAGDLKRQLEALLLTDPLEDTAEQSVQVSAQLQGALGEDSLTEAVLMYLHARYGVHWTQLRGIQAPVRIGEVAILPMTAFRSSPAAPAPTGEADAAKAMVKPPL